MEQSTNTDRDLWNDPAKAQILLRKKARLKERIDSFTNLQSEYKTLFELAELSRSENDQDTFFEFYESLTTLELQLHKARIQSLLRSEVDGNDSYLEVHAGAGGTEAQDWAAMLVRMYQRWAERRNYKIDVLSETSGEEAGIKSTTLRVNGNNAYGWLKSESGVHRLVRISPFDSNSRRHTSFASVGCYPVIEEDVSIDIIDKELRIDTYRASGAGGQHVNKTDSAVRITHEPTGIVVQCQSNRSQHRNRASAMDMLRSRLYEQEMDKRQEEEKVHRAEKGEIGWGRQIRSYVLHPYRMVKDLRTGLENGNTDDVLDGGLDAFIEAELMRQMEVQPTSGKASSPEAAKT